MKTGVTGTLFEFINPYKKDKMQKKTETTNAQTAERPSKSGWKRRTKKEKQRRRMGWALPPSKMANYGKRNRAIVVSFNGESRVTNYKNLEKQGLTHLLPKND